MRVPSVVSLDVNPDHMDEVSWRNPMPSKTCDFYPASSDPPFVLALGQAKLLLDDLIKFLHTRQLQLRWNI